MWKTPHNVNRNKVMELETMTKSNHLTVLSITVGEKSHLLLRNITDNDELSDEKALFLWINHRLLRIFSLEQPTNELIKYIPSVSKKA